MLLATVAMYAAPEAKAPIGAGLCSHTVITMSAEKKALDALRMMREFDVSGVAVVDHDGRLLGNFSMSELRSIMVEHLGALALPIVDFLELPANIGYRSGAPVPPCAACLVH
jgi:CBS domain-containing protein